MSIEFQDNKNMRKKSRKQCPKQLQKKKNLGIDPTMKGKVSQNKNVKTLRNDTEDTRRWRKDIPCAWIILISIIKMAILYSNI